ncbi:phosphatase PAP2 family protein [Hymenobacter sp. BT770]|uniref:phosphatase PAP2 family protein n=1 Tax=Hymenobacter sp. BT770 TaxID=2886942 RepID=UPI001D0F64DA|nr:phosphatase PAP2 family protein [Hymenobacter sp. BT770]MCC3152942.1 phosphatase PAP2 family protein [Hymenobacter sp. BT770]MDO3415144.1 phosphatase PAP2 family protein [Hymenobacter sp. BT770]
MLEYLRSLDVELLLAINRAHTPALDALMVTASDRYTWFPVYGLLIIGLIYLFRRPAILLLPLLILAITLADSITSRLFKPFFARPRPCHDAGLAPLLHLPDGCGGQFGFLSSHAANSFALAVFLAIVLPAGRFRVAKMAVFLWAGLLSYSRMYLGAHYPTDVLGGAAVGALLGWAAATAYQRWSHTLKSST